MGGLAAEGKRLFGGSVLVFLGGLRGKVGGRPFGGRGEEVRGDHGETGRQYLGRGEAEFVVLAGLLGVGGLDSAQGPVEELRDQGGQGQAFQSTKA